MTEQNRTHPLYGARLRWTRADSFLAEADKLVSTWSQKCVDGIVPSDDGRTADFSHWPEVPEMLSVVIGDALHNFRAALDYVVFELARHDSGQPQEQTQFLIEDIKNDPENRNVGFDYRQKRHLRGLHRPHIDMVEAFQPYRDVRWSRSLRDISNPDKHRQLTLLTHDGQLVGVSIRHSPTGRFKGAARIAGRDLAFDRYDVEIDAYSTFVTSGKNPIPVMPELRSIQAGVLEVLDRFEPEFSTT
jgi:hypothetical protein